MKIVLLCIMFTLGSALELTPDNWDSETSGKTVFLKFFAPWCGHCKKMKPAWDQLMDETEIPHVLVADVDCIGEGKSLCADVGVKGFPTVKFGDPSNLEDYKGGRDYDSLSNFVETLTPVCNPMSLDSCRPEDRMKLEKFMDMKPDELLSRINELENELEKVEDLFQETVKELQNKYESTKEEKETSISTIKAEGLGLMKSALNNKQKDEL